MRTKTENGPEVNVERFMEDLRTVVKDGEELLKASFSGVKERAISGARRTDQLVRENPYRTVGLVFGVGILVGLLLLSFGSSAEEEED